MNSSWKVSNFFNVKFMLINNDIDNVKLFISVIVYDNENF